MLFVVLCGGLPNQTLFFSQRCVFNTAVLSDEHSYWYQTRVLDQSDYNMKNSTHASSKTNKFILLPYPRKQIDNKIKRAVGYLFSKSIILASHTCYIGIHQTMLSV